MPVIRVKKETWEMMKTLAKPFEKPDELILRAVMALAEKTDVAFSTTSVPVAAQQPHKKRRSARNGKEGNIAPQELEELIIECLKEVGGSAEKQYVERWIADHLRDRLTPYHWEPLKNEIRWKKMVQFARNRLREASIIRAGSPNGTWELAPA